MRALIILFGAALLIICFPVILSSILDAKTDSYEQTFHIATAAGVTTSNVTLGLDLYGDSLGNIESFTSNSTTDTPSGDVYYDATNQLTVGGLTANVTRALAVTYRYQTTSISDFTTAEYLFDILLWFMALGILTLIAAGLFRAFKHD